MSKLKNTKLPKSIVIFGQRYKIIEEKNLSDENGAIWGQHDPIKKIIRVEQNIGQKYKWSVFFHEYAHAALEESCVGEPVSQFLLEQIAELFAKSIMQLFK